MNLQEWNQLCRKSWENDNVFYKYTDSIKWVKENILLELVIERFI